MITSPTPEFKSKTSIQIIHTNEPSSPPRESSITQNRTQNSMCCRAPPPPPQGGQSPHPNRSKLPKGPPKRDSNMRAHMRTRPAEGGHPPRTEHTDTHTRHCRTRKTPRPSTPPGEQDPTQLQEREHNNTPVHSFRLKNNSLPIKQNPSPLPLMNKRGPTDKVLFHTLPSIRAHQIHIPLHNGFKQLYDIHLPSLKVRIVPSQQDRESGMT